ncbi:hypothetical protein HMPREF1144_3804 [Klebsiella sp. OBRC7]|nr:hypothetical protein HMPREF1144_3804 [Klebsiella sp. OBRC7]
MKISPLSHNQKNGFHRYFLDFLFIFSVFFCWREPAVIWFFIGLLIIVLAIIFMVM